MQNFSPSFFCCILPLSQENKLWNLAERYLCISNERYQVNKHNGREYSLLPKTNSQQWWITALKISTYCGTLFLLPLIVLAYRSICRSQHTFVISADKSSTLPSLLGSLHQPLPHPKTPVTPLPVRPTTQKNAPSIPLRLPPLTGFEEGKATVLHQGQGVEMLIRGTKGENSKIFTAYIQNGSELNSVGILVFRRCHVSKKTGNYKNENGDLSGFAENYGALEEKEPRVSKIYVSEVRASGNSTYKGIGTALMQAVMEYGYFKNCAGRVDLEANGTACLFYWKLGMKACTTANNVRLEQLAKCVKKPSRDSLGSVHMYMPKEKISEWQDKIRTKPIFTRTLAYLPQA